MRVIGIDPGRHGAAADLILEEGKAPYINRVTDLPWLGKGKQAEPDVIALVRWLATPCIATNTYSEPVDLVVLEAMQLMQGDQARIYAVLRMMKSYGEILGALKCVGHHIALVQPRVWQRKLKISNDDLPKERKVRRQKLKENTIVWCQKTYPNTSLIPGRCKKPKDGWADAIAIAHYGAYYYVSKNSNERTSITGVSTNETPI